MNICRHVYNILNICLNIDCQNSVLHILVVFLSSIQLYTLFLYYVNLSNVDTLRAINHTLRQSSLLRRNRFIQKKLFSRQKYLLYHHGTIAYRCHKKSFASYLLVEAVAALLWEVTQCRSKNYRI